MFLAPSNEEFVYQFGFVSSFEASEARAKCAKKLWKRTYMFHFPHTTLNRLLIFAKSIQLLYIIYIHTNYNNVLALGGTLHLTCTSWYIELLREWTSVLITLMSLDIVHWENAIQKTVGKLDFVQLRCWYCWYTCCYGPVIWNYGGFNQCGLSSSKKLCIFLSKSRKSKDFE